MSFSFKDRGGKDVIVWRWVGVSCLSMLAALSTGCQSREPGQWSLGKEAKDLSPELQTAVLKVLGEHCGTMDSPKMLGNDKFDSLKLSLGRDVYLKRCVQCHGVNGDGQGSMAASLYPKPRDYRRGLFKFTTTPYGYRPRRDDLLRTIRKGIPGTSMPAFHLLPEKEIQAVVDWLLVLTHRGELETQLVNTAKEDEEVDLESVPETIETILARWEQVDEAVVLAATPQPKFKAEHISAGKQAFLTRGCAKCHGEDGRGQTPDNLRGDLKDVWGHPTRAADLTSGMLRGGQEPMDVYRRIVAGINGTPMPGFQQALATEPETIWNLVAYVLHVSSERRRGKILEAGSIAPFK